MKTASRTGLVIVLSGLPLLFFLILFELYSHPEPAALLLARPSPEDLACSLRCLASGPVLAVLGGLGKALLLVFLSSSWLYALSRTVLRILRTSAFIQRAKKNAFPSRDARLSPFPNDVTAFPSRQPLAFTAGVLRPRVFVSTRLLEVMDGEELRAVILHEIYHQKSRDPLKGLLVSFVSDFLFFLPISRFLKKRYSFASEMAADAHSLGCRADPLDLVGALLKAQKAAGPAASWFFDPTAERIRHLLGQRPAVKPPLARILLSAAAVALSALLALAPANRSLSAMFNNQHHACDRALPPGPK